MQELRGQKILVTGPTGQVGFPVAKSLASANEVFGLARFAKPEDRERVEAAGVTCVRGDLAAGELEEVPEDIDYVAHFAVAKSPKGDFDADLSANAEGVGLLMARCQRAKAFLHCSTTGVYQHAGAHALRETDPLGDNHRVMMPTYSIAKISAEAVVRFASRQFNLPTTIARLNVPYGNNGGWPIFHLAMMLAEQPVPLHPERPCVYNPIHEEDIVAQLPALLGAASVPATIVNWGGKDTVSIEDWCAYLGELVGVEPSFVETDQTIGSVSVDTSRLAELAGPTRVEWKDGFRRMVETFHPDRIVAPRE